MSFSAPTPLKETSEQDKAELTPLWHVVLLDDNDHTYDYAVEVDTTGRTIVMTCDRPAAEFARDQIHAYGPDWRMPKCKGSMSAVLEPAAG
jgi:ATP-dependent Clp protease adaptor protein ClpS